MSNSHRTDLGDIVEAINDAALRREAMRPPAYDGELAEPISFPASNREVRRRFRLLQDLYRVEDGDHLGLVFKLACAHVPGFQVSFPSLRRGRPRTSLTTKAARRLGITGLPLPPGRPGRRPGARSDDARGVEAADRWKTEQRAAGVQRVSDAAYIRWVCAEIARARHATPASVYKTEGPALKTRLRRARERVKNTQKK